MWDKLLINVATGALTGITGLTYGGLYDVPEVEDARSPRSPKRWRSPRPPASTLSITRPARRLDHGSRGTVRRVQDLDAAEPGKGLDHRDRLHQRLGRALGRNGTTCRRRSTRRWSPASRASSARMADRQRGRLSMNARKAYLEHVAIWVKDIHWHIRFFDDVLRHDDARGRRHRRRRRGSTGRSAACSSSPSRTSPDRKAGSRHLGVMCEDLEAALAAAQRVRRHARCRRAATGCACRTASPSNSSRPARDAVARALAINPRA